MGSDPAIGGTIDMAFQLAYFIHDDRASALHIAISAFRKLKVASTAQGRRIYYTPTGQSGYRAARTKVSVSDLHILQRLIYIESEIYERIEEEGHKESLGQMDMIVRFIKHLVKITLKRNSFYVSLGLSRLLHNYATSEAVQIYNSVVQDPDRARDNYYYRSQKAVLMRELKERFGDMLRIRKAKQREERFEAQEDPKNYLELVRTCLLRFMPWQSECVLPADFDPIRRVVSPLLFEGNHPDEEHTIEMNRIHTLLHPDCFGRLVSASRLDPPDRRLEVPYFFLSNDDPGSLGRRLNPPSLSEEELNVITDRITKEAARRKKNSGRQLSVLVDGIERDRLDLNRTNRLRLEIEAGAELVEVRGRDSSEEIFLATHLVVRGEAGIVPSKSRVILEGGQAFSFEILSTNESPAGTSAALVRIRYRETRPLRATSLFLRQLTFYVPAGFNMRKWSGVLTSTPAQVFLFLVVGIVALLIYFQSTHKPDRPIMVVQKTPLASDEGITSPPRPSLSSPAGANQQGTETRKTESTTPKAKPQEPPAGARPSSSERTRALKRRAKFVTLPAVRRIYVSTADEGPLSLQIRELTIKGLGSIGRFEIVARKEEADAMLDISAIHPLDGGKVTLALQLVNAEGQVLWPKRSAKYSGYPAEITDRVLKDLHNAILKMEKRH